MAPERRGAPLQDAHGARAGDPEIGAVLVQKLECARCHDGDGLAKPPLDRHCVDCHKSILAGTFPAPADALARWQKNIVTLREVPSLTATWRFRRDALARFLVEPHDLRPRLGATMPRLPISPAQARDIVAYVVGDREEDGEDDRSALAGADAAHGRQLVDKKGCGTCHVFTGASPALAASPVPVPLSGDELARGIAMAPDLRHARERLRPTALVRWLESPHDMKPDTPMPSIPLFGREAKDIAAYLVTTPLADAPAIASPARLPVLERVVSFDEVNARVFRTTCWHCHSSKVYGVGDGGPGNTGGFGFEPRRLSFVSYETIAAGMLDVHRERQSVFRADADGVPILVRALLARHDEIGGRPSPDARGMPLGLPPLSPADIQLVDTWIAQGHGR